MTEEKKLEIDPSMIAALKAQVLEELKDEQTRKMEESRLNREKQKKDYDDYVEKMKTSPEPWVDVTGWSETDKGVKVELEWNDSFVDYLRANGVNGADDEQIVQRWVTLLLRDMADQMEERFGGDFE
jgi:hypothetical protein